MRKKSKRKTKHTNGRFFLFFSALLLVVLFFVFSGSLRGATLQRLVYFIGSGVSGTADSADISFEQNDHNQFHLLKSGLAVLSNESLSVFSMSGELKSTTPLTYRTPTVSGTDAYLLAYDRGTTDFLISNGTSILHQAEAVAPIINANINKNGAFSIITDGPDCKTLLSVYNPSMEVIYKLHASEQYVMDAAISNNNKDMTVLSLSVDAGDFVGVISFYHLNEDAPFASHSIHDSVPLSAQYDSDNKVRVLCEDRILLFKKDGTLLCELPFAQDDLLSYTFASSKHIGLLLDDYSAGGHSSLTFLPRNETAPLSISFSEETLSVSAAGNYIAVRCPDKIVVYNRKLELDQTYSIPSGIKSCIMREDGTVLVIGNNFASLLIS
ncbi:MAG: hypothetical protein E7471_00665 [Ruminococcaceae bacterium]|nr:hypothetical protein [Oscillospiraceae bacterium]